MDGELGEFLFGDLDASRIGGSVQVSGHFQAGRCGGGADEAEGLFVT